MRTTASRLLLAGALWLGAAASAHASCGNVVTPINPGGFQGAVNSIPANVTGGDYCIMLNGGVYSENVVIQKKTFASPDFRIIITSAPGTMPVISGPGGTILAVMNDSVTISGLSFRGVATGSYGIRVSSAQVVLSSVTVDDPLLVSAIAAVAVTSLTVISNSSFTARMVGAVGLKIDGSSNTVSFSTVIANSFSVAALEVLSGGRNVFDRTYIYNAGGVGAKLTAGASFNSIGQSTMIANGAGFKPALYLDDSDSNTVTGSFIQNLLGGYAAVLQAGSDHNTISQSTMVAGTFTDSALYLNASGSNTVTGSYIQNLAGHAAFLDSLSDYNTISQSTMVSNVAGRCALQVSAADYNTVTGSYMRNLAGDAASLAAGSDYNTISQSTMTSSLVSGYALNLLGACSSNTITQSFMSNPAGNGVRLGINANYNTISQSTMTSGFASGIALYLAGASFNTITQSNMFDLAGMGAQLDVNSNYNTISQSTMTGGGSFAAFSLFGGSSANMITQSYMSNPTGYAAQLFTNSKYNTISQSTMVSNTAAFVALSLSGASSNTITQSYISNPAGDSAKFVLNSNYNTISFSTSASLGGGFAALTLDQSSNNVINASVFTDPNGYGAKIQNNANDNSITASSFTSAGGGGSNNYGLYVMGASTNTCTRCYLQGDIAGAFLDAGAKFTRIDLSTAAAPNLAALGRAGLLLQGASSTTISGSVISGSTAALVMGSTDTIIQTSVLRPLGGAFGGDGLSVGGGGFLVTLASVTIAAPPPGNKALSLRNVGPLKASGFLDVSGDVSFIGSNFTDGFFSHRFGGDLAFGAGGSYTGAGSTLTLDGANNVPVRPKQTVSYPAGAITFGQFILNASSVVFNGGAAALTAASLTDTVAGSTLAFGAGGTFIIADLTLRGGGGPQGRIDVRSTLGGAPFNLSVGRSTVTAVAVRDSSALGVLHANDGKSVNATGNTNWNFKPFLTLLSPGESFTPGVGKTGVASNQTTGAPFPITVQAYDSSTNAVPSALFPVSFSWTEAYVAPPAALALTAGATLFSNIMARTAGNTVATILPSANAFSVDGTTIPVGPGPLARLQLLLPGQSPVPGSPSGQSGAPGVITQNVPFSVTVRGTDLFWNQTTSGDQVRVTTTAALTSNFPQTATLVSGASTFLNLRFTASTLTPLSLVADDLAPGVTSYTSPAFPVYAASTSSPTVSISIPNGSSRNTLGGFLNGTASDAVAVTKVVVAIQRKSDGYYFDWPANAFSSLLIQYSSSVAVVPFNGAAPFWAMPFSDDRLVDQGAYFVVVRATNPSSNLAVVETTFTYSVGSLGAGITGDGSGTAIMQSASTTSCQLVTSTVVFTAGPQGIAPGGAIALRVPDGWTHLEGPLAANNPPLGSGRMFVASTTTFTLDFNPNSRGNAVLGDNWVVYNPVAPVTPGQLVWFTYTGFVQDPATHVFTVQTQAGPGGNLRPIAAAAALTLTPGPAGRLAFTPEGPLAMGPLQPSPTMQLRVTDLCGASTNSVVAATVTVFAGQFTAGLPDVDATAVFYQAGGALLSGARVVISSGQGVAVPAFYYQTSTAGVTYENLIATVSAGGAFVSGARFVSLPGAIFLSSVTVDTGTLTAGALTATMTANAFASPAFINFKLSQPGLRWEVVISTSNSTYYPPVLRRFGRGDPGRTLSWNGIDELAFPSRFAPAGEYFVRIVVESGVVTSTALRVYLPVTASIYGLAGSSNAFVSASGRGSNYGSFAVASSSGFFQIFGLVAGQTYVVSASTVVIALGKPLRLTSDTTALAQVGGVDVGTMAFATPAYLRLAVALPTPAPREFWAAVQAHTANYAQRAYATLHFSSGASSSDDGAQSFGATASTWSVVVAPAGLYDLAFDLRPVGISSQVVGVTLTAGSALDLSLDLRRKANVFGWAILPSTTPFGAFVSVQGIKAGDKTPTAIGGAFVPGLSLTSATYGLFGLDPGTWTISARSGGFIGVSSTVFISSNADVGAPSTGGFDLSLSSGSVIRGTITVTGNSTSFKIPGPASNPALFELFLNAYSPTTFSRTSTRLILPRSPTLTSSTFTLTGLENGVYQLSSELRGFTSTRTEVAVAGGLGNAVVSLKPKAARIIMTFVLPGPVAPAEFDKIGVLFRGGNGEQDPEMIGSVFSSPGATMDYFPSSATIYTNPLQPGEFVIDGLYNETGMARNLAVTLTQDASAYVTMDLTGPTYNVGGVATLSGGVTFSSANYSVTVSSIAGLLNYSQPFKYCLTSFLTPIAAPSFHVELLPLNPRSFKGEAFYNRALPKEPSGSCNGVTLPGLGPDSPPSFNVRVATLAADGRFQFSKIPPGTYLLRNSFDLDNDVKTGEELPRYSQIVQVTTHTTGLVLRLESGVSVSGNLILPQPVAGRAFAVRLFDSKGSLLQSLNVDMNNSSKAAFTFEKVPDGAYALRVDDLGFPKSYASAPRVLQVQGLDLDRQDVRLTPSGVIRGRISMQLNRPDGSRQFVLVSEENRQLLPPSLKILATANPWFQGGASEAQGDCGPGGCAGLKLDHGQFVIDGLLPGSYDVRFDIDSNDELGGGAVGLVSSFLPGVVVAEGRITDAGIINLLAGVELRGHVFEAGASTRALANIPVSARPSTGGGGGARVKTDRNGDFVLRGLDPTVRFYDVTAAARGEHESVGTILPSWEQKTARSVDLSTASSLSFDLRWAPFSIRAKVGTLGGPGLGLPFSDSGQRQAGALAFLQKTNEVPARPPADIRTQTDPSGTLFIPALATGTYRLTLSSLDYSSLSRLVSITSASVDLGAVTLTQGGTLSGAIRKPDGSQPSDREVDRVMAATSDLSELLFGSLASDANTRSVSGYTISGFRAGVTYRLLIAGRGGDIRSPEEARRIVFSTTTEARSLDVIFRAGKPVVLAKAKRLAGVFQLTFEMSQPLRGKTAQDDDLTVVLSTLSAQGVLSQFELSPNRSRLTALYTPGVAESSFTLRLNGYSSLTDEDSVDRLNPEFVMTSTVVFFTGIDGLHRANITNFAGGNMLVEGDAGRLALPTGVFSVDASSSVEVTLQISNESLVSPQVAAARTAAEAVSANLGALRYGSGAYPSDILRAMAATPPQVSPFSGFYDVLLPLGIRTALSKPVPMTIAYSTGTDPTTINLYWYNAAANAYILQQDVTGAKPVIDTVNHTITINVNHFSTFVMFQTGVAVISGNAFAGGDIEAFNFPNPFDLSEKVVTSIHGAPPTTVRGTMIRISLPLDVSGDSSVRIFDLAGEKVRTISLGTLAGGRYYYQGWDGRNDSGRDVASGVYLAQVKVGGKSKFFKMALIK